MENYIVKPISSRIYAVHQHHPHHHPPPLIPRLIHYTGYCCCSCFCCCSSDIQYYRIWCYFNIIACQLSLVSISLFGIRQFILLTKTTTYRLTTTSFCHYHSFIQPQVFSAAWRGSVVPHSVSDGCQSAVGRRLFYTLAALAYDDVQWPKLNRRIRIIYWLCQSSVPAFRAKSVPDIDWQLGRN